MIPGDPFKQLHDLDRTSPKFYEQLSDFFRGNVYRSALTNAESKVLTWLVEYLDSVLVDISDHAAPIFEESLRELKKICGANRVLPESCTLPESLLGCVYQGTFNGSKVRVRRVRTCPGGNPQRVKEEFHQAAVILKHLTHPNIVPTLGVTIDPLEIISDWMPGGDLLRYITLNHQNANRISLLTDVAEGLNYLHSCNVIHGDLRGSSVLVDAAGRARITDIGLAVITRDLDSMQSASTNHDGDVRWIAPEIFDGRGTFSKEGDVFSFAGVAIEIFTGAVPFHDKPPYAAIQAIMSGDRPSRPSDLAVTNDLWAFMQQCWNQEAHLRPHALRVSSLGVPVWKRIVELPAASDKQVSLIKAMFSDLDEVEEVKNLRGDDAQSFIEAMDEVLDKLTPSLRRQCLKILCRICGHQALLPRSVQIPLCYDQTGTPLYHGGLAEVWKGQYQGCDVAVKVLKVYQTSNFERITRRFCKEVMTWKTLCHPNVLPLLGVKMVDQRFAMVSEWMVNGNINEFVGANKDANRWALLADVVHGLIYMHGEGIIHGDLKGANVLIDRKGHACLADFGLVIIISDPACFTASLSLVNGGTVGWMSPELLSIDNCQPSQQSDCYALGMVIYEVLSGKAPFSGCRDFVVIRRVLEGDRPQRPEVDGFTDDVWRTLECCWLPQPENRPAIEAILECLGRAMVATIDFTLQQMIDCPSSQDGLVSLLETIFSSLGPTVVPNAPNGKPPSSWDVIADHALQENPDAVSILMHHCDLAKIRIVRNKGSLPLLPAERRPRITVGANRAGRTAHQEIQQPEVHAKRSNMTTPANYSQFTMSAAGVLMRLPNHPVLQKLRNLDRSLSEFHDQFCNILYGEEYVRYVKNLEGDDLRWLVNYLDEAFDGLPPISAASRKCLLELRTVCGTGNVPPTSCILLPNLVINLEPFHAVGFSDVYRGTLDSSHVCIKRVRVSPSSDGEEPVKMFYREAVVWKHMKHPNMVPLLGITIEPLQLISGWMPGGDLLDHVKNPGADRLLLLSDIAEGLCYLHSYNVIHGNLKGRNILVDNTGHARITDFGRAEVAQDMDLMEIDTPNSYFSSRWTAPEVLRYRRHSDAADIFSFAMVMVEVFSGTIPFAGRTVAAAAFDILGGKRPQRPIHPTLTPGLWALMQRCWNQDPYLRPTAVEVSDVLCGTDRPTWKRLISDPLVVHERISLVTMIFSDPNQVKMVGDLSGDVTQIFVDRISEVLDGLAPQVHRKCLRYLYRICGNQALLPRSLEIPLCCDLAERHSSRGGLANVLEGEHEGRKVAVRVSRMFPEDDIEKIKKRFCSEVVTWRALHHPNTLPLVGVTMTKEQLATVSDWMPKGTIKEYIEVNPDVDRLGLLRGVTRGLAYMHDRKIIHGDLRGVNILIDNDDNPRLTGFSMVMMASKQPTIVPPPRANGTIPWTSPELLCPERFSLKNNYPTVRSDGYALGMVIYEVLSGRTPFATYKNIEVVLMVLGSERPERPRGNAGGFFTDEIWEVLGLCWNQQPSDRPDAKHVLMCLDGRMPPLWPSSGIAAKRRIPMMNDPPQT